MMNDKPKIKVDLSDWGLGEWPDMLGKALLDGLRVQKDSMGFEIEFDDTVFEPAVRKIARESIETFINESVAGLTVEGLELIGEYEGDYRVLVPWASPLRPPASVLDRFSEWIRKWRAELAEDEQ
jgi:hypothetical protein